jgi:hypothetical protein
MRDACFGWIVFCVLAATLGCRARSPDWNGTWRLNPSKSSLKGAVVTISILTDGEYRYDDGYTSFTFRCDEKYQQIGKNRTQACVKSSATMLEMTRKENGVKTNAYRWELSDSGKVLTVTAAAFRPSGPVITGQIFASRISGSTDFAGQWRDLGSLQRLADMTLKLDSQSLHISYPKAGQYMDAPLSGIGATVHGPYPPGLTYSVRLAGQRKFLILAKRNGKVLNQQSLELSNHDRVLTDSWRNPDQLTGKDTLVYDKK